MSSAYFEGLKEDWFCQLGHPRKIKNLLTYLLTIRKFINEHYQLGLAGQPFAEPMLKCIDNVLVNEVF